jgi:hypothetical protein
MKFYFFILIFPFVINCSTLKSGKPLHAEQKIEQVIPNIQHFNKADINKDNVIDKNESIQFYKKNNSINYDLPFTVFSIMAGVVLFICFWPLVISYVSSLIKRFKKSS